MLKEHLLRLNIAEDNHYLDKYIDLVSKNTLKTKFERHHIVPVSYYKINNQPVNNSENNIVKLSTYDHILAHYYACLCFKEPLKSKMIYAFCLMSKENRLFLEEDETVVLEKLEYVSELREQYTNLLSQRVVSEETLEKMKPSWFKKGQTAHNKGKPCSEHTKELLRLHNLAYPSKLTDNGRKHISEANSGPKSDETRQKMKNYSNNRKETHLKNLSIAATGKTHAHDGVRNRWWKKDKPLPEGWTWGWK